MKDTLVAHDFYSSWKSVMEKPILSLFWTRLVDWVLRAEDSSRTRTQFPVSVPQGRLQSCAIEWLLQRHYCQKQGFSFVLGFQVGSFCLVRLFHLPASPGKRKQSSPSGGHLVNSGNRSLLKSPGFVECCITEGRGCNPSTALLCKMKMVYSSLMESLMTIIKIADHYGDVEAP
jgi:hypothetical protein